MMDKLTDEQTVTSKAPMKALLMDSPRATTMASMKAQ
jgi:hypothetical protein